MRDTKFTPGPWAQVPQSNGSVMIARRHETGKQLSPHGLRLVCNVLVRGSSMSEDDANAHLIAAAPEMYEALERIYGRLLMSERDGDAHITEEDGAMVEAALRKARGEA